MHCDQIKLFKSMYICTYLLISDGSGLLKIGFAPVTKMKENLTQIIVFKILHIDFLLPKPDFKNPDPSS